MGGAAMTGTDAGSGKTLQRWECDECGKAGLLDAPRAGWHVDGWHVSARAMEECMTGPRSADTRCFGVPIQRTYVHQETTDA